MKVVRDHILLKAVKCGGYICDVICLVYKSAKICSCTVAVALKTGNIDKEVKRYITTKKTVQISQKLVNQQQLVRSEKEKSSKYIKSVASN